MLRKEQKDLLTNYIISFSDNGLGLKSFLNNEIGRLKESIQSLLDKNKDTEFGHKLSLVENKLNDYSKVPINKKMVEEIFYIQDLLAEVSKDGN